jgi:hypothetical protein
MREKPQVEFMFTTKEDQKKIKLMERNILDKIMYESIEEEEDEVITFWYKDKRNDEKRA